MPTLTRLVRSTDPCTCSGVTVQVNVVVAVLLNRSRTVTVTLDAGPAAVGMPEITPVAGSIASPAGMPVADQANGAAPPLSTTDSGVIAALMPVIWFAGWVNAGRALMSQVNV